MTAKLLTPEAVAEQLAVLEVRLLTGQEVARMLSVTPAWVRAHASGNRQPVLPSVKMGKERRYRPDAVLDFIGMCERHTWESITRKRRSAA